MVAVLLVCALFVTSVLSQCEEDSCSNVLGGNLCLSGARADMKRNNLGAGNVVSLIVIDSGIQNVVSQNAFNGHHSIKLQHSTSYNGTG